MDDLARKALDAADAIIAEHGYPWNLNPGGLIETTTEKSRLMLALGFSKGYGHGVQEMGTMAEDAMQQLITDLRNA